jgi:hypothetical protein
VVYVFYDNFLNRLRQTLDDPNENPSYLGCPLCGEPWIGLIRHLMQHHKLSYAAARKLRIKAKPWREMRDG